MILPLDSARITSSGGWRAKQNRFSTRP